MNRKAGQYRKTVAGGETVASFVPSRLPPRDPPLELGPELVARLRRAETALARLDLAGRMVPSLDWFIYAFVRKEAVITSQIEGTQATLIDLLAYEAQPERAPDAAVEEICNYVDALRHARAELADPKGLPLSIRLLNRAHRRLMQGTRGAGSQPGEIRRSQNWIGGSRPGDAVYVPPPPDAVAGLLGDLEKYWHADDTLPPLIRAGLVHAQFESIHPYLDGNGRIGRLLVALLVEHWGLLSAPLLYISLHFKRHRPEYYRRLNAVRTAGDWEGWIGFFLDGVGIVAEEAIATAGAIFGLVSSDRIRVLEREKSSLAALRLFESLPERPIVSLATAMRATATTKPTTLRAIATLVDAGILVETSGRRRDRSFAYRAYIEAIRGGTDLGAD